MTHCLCNVSSFIFNRTPANPTAAPGKTKFDFSQVERSADDTQYDVRLPCMSPAPSVCRQCSYATVPTSLVMQQSSLPSHQTVSWFAINAEKNDIQTWRENGDSTDLFTDLTSSRAFVPDLSKCLRFSVRTRKSSSSLSSCWTRFTVLLWVSSLRRTRELFSASNLSTFLSKYYSNQSQAACRERHS